MSYKPELIDPNAEEEPPPPPPVEEILPEETETEEALPKGYRGGANDPIFGFLLAVALSIGLTPLLPEHADLRYTLAWGAMAGVGVLGWLLGSAERITQEDPADLLWGIGFGLLVGVLFLLFGGDVLERAALLIFPSMSVGTVLAYLVFVMPLAETLFFRGILQQTLEFWVVGALAGLWQVLLFFPVMWADVLAAPIVALVIALALLTINIIQSYVKERNGLAASWLCQIILLLLMLLIPFL